MSDSVRSVASLTPWANVRNETIVPYDLFFADISSIKTQIPYSLFVFFFSGSPFFQQRSQ
jgi:hypothetical protein